MTDKVKPGLALDSGEFIPAEELVQTDTHASPVAARPAETKPSEREALVKEAKRLVAQLRSHAFNEGADNERPHMSDRFYEKSANKARATQDELRAAIDRLAAPPAGEQQAECDGLRRDLADMEARKDAAYLERNQVVAALAKAFPSGVARTAIEGWSEDWHGCVYIDLPTGQASWHFHDSQAYLFDGLPPYTKPWDGHSTEEKYRRLAALKTAGEQAQPVMVEAVAEVEEGDDGMRLHWLIEGGISAIPEGVVLVMPHEPITEDDGSGEVYRAAPASAPSAQPLTAEVERLSEALRQIGDYAHDHSTGPAIPDALWEVRQMAYEAITE